MVTTAKASKVNAGLFKSGNGDWGTPQDLFDRLDRVWSFTLDPAASDENHKCARYFTKEQDGLAQPWQGERVFLNPPYGKVIGDWVRKAALEASLPNTIVVCLLPARTDTRWWQTYCSKATYIRFLPGRVRFQGAENSAPFPSAIVIFGEIA